MYELILLASLNPMMTAQVQPCVWPNLCVSQPTPVVVQVQPCVWPNLCESKPAPVAALLRGIVRSDKDYQTCVFPNKCS